MKSSPVQSSPKDFDTATRQSIAIDKYGCPTENIYDTKMITLTNTTPNALTMPIASFPAPLFREGFNGPVAVVVDVSVVSWPPSGATAAEFELEERLMDVDVDVDAGMVMVIMGSVILTILFSTRTPLTTQISESITSYIHFCVLR
jgi:hypothetical protein